MKLTKPSPGLIAEFKAVAAELPQGEPRKMFGYDALFVNGNMAVGLWQNTCVVKVSEADQARLLELGHGQPFMPMKGRAMFGWLELSEEVAHDPEELLAWSRRAIEFVATLPPKQRKARAAEAPAKASPAKNLRPAAAAPRAKASPAKKPVAKTSVAEKPVAKKPVAKKAVAKKAVAKKAVAKKAVAKKAVAKKPVAKNAKKPDAKRPVAKKR